MRKLSERDMLRRAIHKPKLLSDNGPFYIAAELAEWIDPMA